MAQLETDLATACANHDAAQQRHAAAMETVGQLEASKVHMFEFAAKLGEHEVHAQAEVFHDWKGRGSVSEAFAEALDAGIPLDELVASHGHDGQGVLVALGGGRREDGKVGWAEWEAFLSRCHRDRGETATRALTKHLDRSLLGLRARPSLTPPGPALEGEVELSHEEAPGIEPLTIGSKPKRNRPKPDP